MKLVQSTHENLLFALSAGEKTVLWSILRLYPRVPASYPRLRKTGTSEPASQRLLEESLAQQRDENHRQLVALLEDSSRLKKADRGWRLSLSCAETQWLLQVLNDVRVGSWIRLGSPETLPQMLSPDTSPDAWAMEVAGWFEMCLLEALDSR